MEIDITKIPMQKGPTGDLLNKILYMTVQSSEQTFIAGSFRVSLFIDLGFP